MDADRALRLLCCHKQKTSARLRFLRLGASVLAPEPLPPGACLCQDGGALRPHPAPALRRAEEYLGLGPGSLEAEAGFHVRVETPAGDVHVLLAAFTSIDPPFAAAARLGGRFVAITELADLPALELEILRRIYEHMIG